MPRRKVAKTFDPKAKRKRCPKCGIYVDGKQQAHDHGGPVLHSIPGMQRHRKTTGDLYEMSGVNIPCGCDAGVEVDRGYRRQVGGEMIRHNRPADEFFKDYPIRFDLSDKMEEERKMQGDLPF